MHGEPDRTAGEGRAGGDKGQINGDGRQADSDRRKGRRKEKDRELNRCEIFRQHLLF